MTDEVSWDQMAATWDEGGPVAYANAAAASLTERAPALGLELKGARVFDFGCGTGLLSERLASAGAVVVGLDPSEGMIDRLQAKIDDGLAGVTALNGTLADLSNHPALQGPFDLVVASSVCAFLDDYPGTLKAMAAMLKPSGLFVQWDWELRAEDEEPFGLTRDAIRSALTGAGFEVCAVETGFEAPFGEMTMTPLTGIGRKP